MGINAVMVVPTGLGCSIGGDAGDATPAARVLASVCDTLVLHPNVVNACDICELPSNALYVEGSLLDLFMNGHTKLERPRRGNRILVVVNELNPTIVNGVNAARSTLGVHARLLELETPLRMKATFDDEGRATGEVSGVEGLVAQVNDRRDQWDALAVVTPIEVDPEVARNYLMNGGVNPWGGVEALASRMIAWILRTPVAHAPFVPADNPLSTFNEVVNPSQAAEMVSTAYLFCVMKGLHFAPRSSSTGFSIAEVDALVTPINCWGPPHEAANLQRIPVIAVRSNRPSTPPATMGPHVVVENYLEAAGLLAAMGAGVDPDMVDQSVNRSSQV